MSINEPETRTFICPMPQAWNRIYSILTRAAEKHGLDKPPVPLILAAWHVSPHLKQERWSQTLEWAKSNDLERLIPELKEEDRFYVQES